METFLPGRTVIISVLRRVVTVIFEYSIPLLSFLRERERESFSHPSEILEREKEMKRKIKNIAPPT